MRVSRGIGKVSCGFGRYSRHAGDGFCILLRPWRRGCGRRGFRSRVGSCRVGRLGIGVGGGRILIRICFWIVVRNSVFCSVRVVSLPFAGGDCALVRRFRVVIEDLGLRGIFRKVVG